MNPSIKIQFVVMNDGRALCFYLILISINKGVHDETYSDQKISQIETLFRYLSLIGFSAQITLSLHITDQKNKHFFVCTLKSRIRQLRPCVKPCICNRSGLFVQQNALF